MSRRTAILTGLGGVAAGAVGARIGESSSTSSNYDDIIDERGFEGNWAEAALKSFVPPGESDPYFIFASGGHSGQMYVIGVPSMRLLKTIPVFTREAWTGYGFGADQSEAVLTEGSDPAKSNMLGWGDTHHPALSETGGDYDGRWCYINDRANGRIAMIDLRDFKTKQIVDVPNLGTSHGGCFITPNSDYVHISSMTPYPYLAPGGYAPLSDYKEMLPRRLHLDGHRPRDRPDGSGAQLPDRAPARTPRTSPTPASWSATASGSSTPTTPRWPSVAPSRTRRTRSSRRRSPTTTTSSTSSTGRRPSGGRGR